MVVDVYREALLQSQVLSDVVKLSSRSHYLSTLIVMLLFMSDAEREETKCLKYFVTSLR